MRAMVFWITVQVARVCFMSMPKNRLTSQNPESLTWEKPTDPADIAITIATICSWETSLAAITPTISEAARSEEHTSELQSRGHLVCRLLLEKKNATTGERRR